jgi:hypothetical protein
VIIYNLDNKVRYPATLDSPPSPARHCSTLNWIFLSYCFVLFPCQGDQLSVRRACGGKGFSWREEVSSIWVLSRLVYIPMSSPNNSRVCLCRVNFPPNRWVLFWNSNSIDILHYLFAYKYKELCSLFVLQSYSPIFVLSDLFYLFVMAKVCKKFDDVSEIVPTQEYVRIKVRVLRLWKVPVFLLPGETSSIEMVLVDEKVLSCFLSFFIDIYIYIWTKFCICL